ncbi:Glycosyl hydrolase family 65 central catalytic domain-containing protein [Streptomyces sp. PAN_FS17]|nr:Glycosyl hydrolase family 65 central catalytic domain-containing protein [Streptomyces sp. PAN_FS17]
MHAFLDHRHALDNAPLALEADIADIQGGTTAEGIRLGAMAGTLDLVQRGLTGLGMRADALWLDPVPLPALSESLRARAVTGQSAYGAEAGSWR